MTIREVTMYRVECDVCGHSPQDDSGYYAWSDQGEAICAADGSDWFTGGGREVCPDCFRCDVCRDLGRPAGDHLVCEKHEDYDDWAALETARKVRSRVHRALFYLNRMIEWSDR